MRRKIFLLGAMAILASGIVALRARARQSKRGQEGPPAAEEMKGKTAGEVYKNIKVLKSIPAGQLLDGMRYISIALGVSCDFCHNMQDFASDQKRPKKIARKMMSMLFTTNRENFDGKPMISCYTCHRGDRSPVFAPLPAVTAAQPATGPVPPSTLVKAEKIKLTPGTKLPTVDQVLAKYAQALGGEAALANVNTREILAKRTGLKENSPPMEQRIYEMAPSRFAIVTQTQDAILRSGYDGKRGWMTTPRGIRGLDGMNAVVPVRDAGIDPAAALARYTEKRMAGMARIGGQKTYVITGHAPDGMIEQLYFAVNSGLLLRRVFVYHTIFGPLLFQANYSDYRNEGNVAIPFRTEWWAAGSGFTETVQSVKTNLTIADARFQPPPGKAAAGKADAR